MRIRRRKRTILPSYGPPREGPFARYRFPGEAGCLLVWAKLSGPSSTWRLTYEGREAVVLVHDARRLAPALLDPGVMQRLFSGYPACMSHYQRHLVPQLLFQLEAIHSRIQQLTRVPRMGSPCEVPA